jgi:tetratricopeptide (TPR) repeat protein
MQLMLKEFDGKDLSQTDPLYQQAFALFVKAQLDEALSVLHESQLQAERDRIEQEEKATLSRKAQLADTYLLKAQILSLKFDFVNAEINFLNAISIYPSWKAYLEVALFFKDQNQFNEAIDNLKSALFFAHHLHEKVGALSNLGLLYSDLLDFEQAESFYLKVKNLLTACKENTGNYNDLYSLAIVLNNLGSLERDRNRDALALDYFRQSIEIKKKLVELDSSYFLPSYAGSLTNLGLCLLSQNQFLNAEELLLESLSHYRIIESSNPLKYLPDIAVVQSSLASLYNKTHRYETGKRYLLDALSIQRGLANDNSQKFAPELAKTLLQAANLYVIHGELEKGESLFQEALVIFRSLSKVYPAVYLPNLAELLMSLGVLYRDLYSRRLGLRV